MDSLRLGRGGARGAAEGVAEEVLGEAVRGGVVEEEGGGQAGAEPGADAVAQFDGGDGVHAEVAQWLVGAYGLGRAQPEGARGLLADEGQDTLGPLGLGQPGEPVGQRLAGVHAGVRCGQQRAPQGGADGVGLAQAGQVEGPGDQMRGAVPHGQLHEVAALVRGEGAVAEPGHAVQVGVGGGETFAGPGAEGDGAAGQAQGPPGPAGDGRAGRGRRWRRRSCPGPRCRPHRRPTTRAGTGSTERAR